MAMALLSMASRPMRRLQRGAPCQNQKAGHREAPGTFTCGAAYRGYSLAPGSPRMKLSSGSYGLSSWRASQWCCAQRDGFEEGPMGGGSSSSTGTSTYTYCISTLKQALSWAPMQQKQQGPQLQTCIPLAFKSRAQNTFTSQ